MKRCAVFLLAILGCRGIPAAPADDDSTPPATATSDPFPPAASPGECPEVDLAAAEADFERGREQLERARDGEHYRYPQGQEALAVVRGAAERGSVRAHSLFGRRQFEWLFLSQAPQPDEQRDYVHAFTSLIIAAHRADPDLDDYLPGLKQLEVVDGALLPTSLPEPLDQIPSAWLVEATRAAMAWLACHPSGVEYVLRAPAFAC